MLRRFGWPLLAGLLTACVPKPESPPPPQPGGTPPFFALRAHGELTPEDVIAQANMICGDYDLDAVLRRTEGCESFFRGETIPNCWNLTFLCRADD